MTSFLTSACLMYAHARDSSLDMDSFRRIHVAEHDSAMAAAAASNVTLKLGQPVKCDQVLRACGVSLSPPAVEWSRVGGEGLLNRSPELTSVTQHGLAACHCRVQRVLRLWREQHGKRWRIHPARSPHAVGVATRRRRRTKRPLAPAALHALQASGLLEAKREFRPRRG